MALQFGILLSAAYDGPDPRSELEIRYDQVRAARDFGFDAVVIGQHFVSPPMSFFQPIPTLASIAAMSGSMKLGIAVLLLPFFHPVDVAEQITSLDIITGGRLILGVGLGWRQDEIRAFGLERQQVLPRYLDSLDVLPQLWTQPSVTYHGRHYHLEDVQMTSRPLQKPYPPIWMGGSSDKAIIRAAKRGNVWLGSSHLPKRIIFNQARLYRETLAATSLPDPGIRPLMRNLFVDESREAALASVSPFIDSYYKSFAKWGLFNDVIKSGTEKASTEEILDHMAVVGDPDDCTRQLQNIIDETGANFLIFKIQWPGLDPAKVYRSMKLLTEKVKPNLRPAE